MRGGRGGAACLAAVGLDGGDGAADAKVRVDEPAGHVPRVLRVEDDGARDQVDPVHICGPHAGRSHGGPTGSGRLPGLVLPRLPGRPPRWRRARIELGTSRLSRGDIGLRG